MIASVDELEARMLRAKPGETVEYWRGRLASDREYMGTYPWLDALARRIMELAMSGELIASQRRSMVRISAIASRCRRQEKRHDDP